MAKNATDEIVSNSPRAGQVELEDGDLADFKARQKSLYSERDSLIEEMRALRFMENSVDIPVAFDAEEVRTPLANLLVQNMVGGMTTEPVSIVVPPAAMTAKAQDASSKMESWLSAAIEQLTRQADDDVIERFIECLIADGHGCMRMLYSPQYWKGFPRKKKEEPDEEYNDRAELWKKGQLLPISWNWVDPLNCYPLWGEMGLEAMLEVDKRDLWSLNPDRFNMAKNNPELWDFARIKREDSGEVEFTQLWTRHELIYSVNDVIVHRQKHGYRAVPYAYGMGQTVSSRDPAKMGLSILYALRYLVPYVDRLLSQRATQIRIWCWPTPVFRMAPLSPTDETGQPRPLEIVPGHTLTLFEGEELGFLVWEGSGPDTDKQLAIVMNFIERTGLTDAMFGMNPSSDSGYAINQLLGAARMKYRPITVHAERAIEAQLTTLLDIVEYQIKQPVYIFARGKNAGWLDLSPDDLQGYRQIQVSANPIMPTDVYARSSRVINEVRAGLSSRRRAMEEIGIGQPEDEMNQILIEAWKASDEVQAVLKAEVVKRFGLKLQQAREMPIAELIGALQGSPPAAQQAALAYLTQGTGMPGPNVPGLQGAAVMAGPNIQAAPGPPAMPPTLGRQVRPAGIARGMAPGPERRGQF